MEALAIASAVAGASRLVATSEFNVNLIASRAHFSNVGGGIEEIVMRVLTTFLAAATIIVAPAATFARPGTPQSAPTTNSSPFGHTGQPSVECEDFGEDSAPGHSGTAPGSAFNEDGNAGDHYAGEQPGINDKNPHSVSQYDTACARNHSPTG